MVWGILVLMKEKESHHIQLIKEDENKQYLWLKISENEKHIRIATCYFAPQVSKTYKNKGLDNKDPYVAFKTRYCRVLSTGRSSFSGRFQC